MGRIITLSCEKCNFQKELWVGAGLMSRNPDAVSSGLEKGEADKWNNLYDSHSIEDFSAQQEAVYCDTCKELKSSLYVEAQLNDGSSVLIGDCCRKCSGKLRRIDLREDIVCPVCGEAHLNKKETGFWD